MLNRNRRNGHKKPQPAPLAEMPDDGLSEELHGPWNYLYGDKDIVALAKVSRVPKHMVIPIAAMRMQSRLCELTGQLDDPDLAELFERDIHELMIGLEGEGRREAVTMAQAEGTEEEGEDDARFFGNLMR